MANPYSTSEVRQTSRRCLRGYEPSTACYGERLKLKVAAWVQLNSLCHHSKRSTEQDASFVIEVGAPPALKLSPAEICLVLRHPKRCKISSSEMHDWLQDEKLAANADNLLSCITVLDGSEHKHQIAYMDKAYEQLSGYSRDELLGRPFLEVHHLAATSLQHHSLSSS